MDGSRLWIELGDWPNSPQGRERARESAAHWAEKMREKGIVAGPARYRGDRSPDDATMAAWVSAWIKSRELRGMTSARENRSHYEQHVQPVLGELHVREWTVDDPPDGDPRRRWEEPHLFSGR